MSKTIGELTAASVPVPDDSLLEVEVSGVSKQMSIADLLPAGFILPYGGTSAPDGFLECDGTAVSRTTYARLFAAISTTWGAGDGSTTFNLPDARGSVLRGAGSHGTETMANGNPYAGPAVGSYEDDQMQGHFHETYRDKPGSGAQLARSTAIISGVASNVSQAREAITDGSNGTPRTGAETRGFAAGVLYCIKA